MTKNIGTPLYIAPEVEKNDIYDHRVDVYSLGLILFEMFVIIRTVHEKQDLFKDLKKNRKLPSSLEKNFPEESKVILLLTRTDRPRINEVLNSSEYMDWKDKMILVRKNSN